MGRSRIVFGRVGGSPKDETIWLGPKYWKEIDHMERIMTLMTGDIYSLVGTKMIPKKFPWQYQYARRRWWEIVKDDILARTA